MSIIYRVNCRIREEGILTTIKYFYKVFTSTFFDFLHDSYLDIRYSGRLLNGNQKSKYADIGANDVYHTKYSAMNLIFMHSDICKSDVLVDVGCGKGRIINYWLSQGYKNNIIGLELDPQVANNTSHQFRKRNNVTIIQGDAIDNLPKDGTVFYFYNPFNKRNVERFEEAVYNISKGKKITIIYYNPKSIHVFLKDYWDVKYVNFETDLGIKRWGRLNKYHDLAIIRSKT